MSSAGTSSPAPAPKQSAAGPTASTSEHGGSRPIPYRFTSGKRVNSKLVYTPSDQQLYKSCKQKNSRGQVYRCYNYARDKCTAKVFLVDGTVCVRSEVAHNHSATNETFYATCCVKNAIKSTVAARKSADIRAVYDGVMAQNQHIPIKFQEIERNLRHTRSKVMPDSPATVNEIITAFAVADTMREFGQSHHADSELFFNTAFANDEFSYCVLSSATSVKMILDNNGSSSYRMDTTFRIVPRGCFKHMLIVYVEYDEKIFPFVFVLLSTKSEPAYVHALEYIREHIYPLEDCALTINVDLPLKRALRQMSVVSATTCSCWYHFVHGVHGHAACIPDLFRILRIDRDLSSCALVQLYYKYMCLALLPADQIVNQFNAITALFLAESHPPLQTFVTYFWKQWIEKNRVSGRGRTTCLIEIYNDKFGIQVKDEMHFFKYVAALQKEEFAQSCALSDHIQGNGPPTKIRIKLESRDNRIARAIDRLDRGNITPEKFLVKLATQSDRFLPDCVFMLEPNKDVAMEIDFGDDEDFVNASRDDDGSGEDDLECDYSLNDGE